MTSTTTRARIRNFGAQATEARIAARVAKDYTPAAWAADKAARATRQEATVDTQDMTLAEAAKHDAHGTRCLFESLLALAAVKTPWVKESDISLFAATNTVRVVTRKIAWLRELPVAELGDNTEFKAPVQDQPQPAKKLQKREAKPPTADVPEGRYAVTGEDGTTKFYRVDVPTEGRWAGYTFVERQAGDDLFKVRNRDERNSILAKIAADGIEAAMLRYGRELGHCGHCGRTLTNPDSLERGIGPICAAKMGF